jgi:hypothetical protein
MKGLAHLLLIALMLGLAGCGGTSHAGGEATAGQATMNPQLTDLHSIGQLRSLFNRASTEPRLVVLVSPT